MIFLISYDRKQGLLDEMIRFTDQVREQAQKPRLDKELANLHAGIEKEVVILEAAREGLIRKTHRRYFETLTEIAT